MTSYPFLKDLFTNVLLKSKAIEGRFFVSSNIGREINSDLLDQVITDTVTQVVGQKYPLALMLPPRSKVDAKYKQDEMEAYAISMFFLTTTYRDSNNQVSNSNPYTQTSMHTILEDWHDMKRCAMSFLRVLDRLQKITPGLLQKFRMIPGEKIFKPISVVGVNRVSGVQVDFQASLFAGCDVEDYDADEIPLITIPAADSHPEHDL